MADGGWASKTRERSFRELKVIETMEYFASARSAMTNSAYIRVKLTRMRIENTHTEAVIQKKQDTGLSREKLGNTSTEGSNAFVQSGIGNLHGTSWRMLQICTLGSLTLVDQSVLGESNCDLTKSLTRSTSLSGLTGNCRMG
jgi:hypothetical protein